MKTKMLIILTLGIMIVLCGCTTGDKVADTQYLHATWATTYNSIEELLEKSDLVAVVKVESMDEVRFIGASNIPFSTYTLVIQESILGCYKDDKISVGQTGMLSDEKTIEIEDDPMMEVGKMYLIFARENSDGTYTILSGSQGRYLYDEGYIYPVVKMESAENSSKLPNQKTSLEDVIKEIESVGIIFNEE